jgi:predicted TIM-barrel fold metal-dependent hydrolase
MNWRIVAGIFVVIFAGVGVYAAFVATGDVWDKRVQKALAPAECPSVSSLFAPDFGTPYYQGPLIDTHFHIPNPPDGPSILDDMPSSSDRPMLGKNVTIADFVCTFKVEGTKKVFAFFPVFPGFEEPLLEIAKGTMERYPDFFVPFVMPPDRDDRPDGFPTVTAEVLKDMLGVYPKLFEGYGEIGLYVRGDHGGPTGSPALPPDSERLHAIYPVIRENNLIVYFHLGVGQQEAFERVLSENPDINFIWHGDQLIPYDENGQHLEALDEILSRHPNAHYSVDELYGDVQLLRPDASIKEFFEHFDDYEELLRKDLRTWKAFIERHPDQVMWGTDRGVSTVWSIDSAVGLTLTRYTRTFIAQLDPSVQEKYAYKNAERLLLDK